MSHMMSHMMHHAHHAANWTNTTGFDCVGIHRLPFKGTEILVLTIVYLALVAMYCATFIDVAIKQAWPAKFLDAVVMKRIQKLQEDFPRLKPTTGVSEEDEEDQDEEWDAAVKVTKADGTLGEIRYDSIVSQEPYAATSCIDEDLTFILANNTAYSTVSSYCSSTVRGYAMLSTMLPVIGTTLGFLWVHNAMINPIGDNYARYLAAIGYFMCFLTGIVMCQPDSKTVHRNRNILLWSSVLTNNKVLRLHGIGIVGFCVVPMLGNVMQLWWAGPELPNRAAMHLGIVCQVVGLVIFEGPSLVKKCHLLTSLQAAHIGIIGEILCVMASIISFVQIETFSSAACSQMVSTYALVVAGTVPSVMAILFVKHYAGAPTRTFANGPSVMLMNGSIPVAVSGPAPVLNYNREMAILPIIQPKK